MHKFAQGDTLPVTAPPSTSPVPEVTITPQPPAGKKGPAGTAPRTNYSRVNSITPPVPDAGAGEQKSIQPEKYGSQMMHNTPTLHDLVTAASQGTLSQAKLAAEAMRQSGKADDTKEEKKKEASAPVSSEYISKLAGALFYLSDEVSKEAATQEPGKGPGALAVTEATASTPLPDHKGQATPRNVVPMTPGVEKVLPADKAPTQMATDDKKPAGGSAVTPEKVAEANLAHLLKLSMQAPRPAVNFLGKGKSFPVPTSAPRPGALSAIRDKATGAIKDFSKKAEDQVLVNNLALFGIKIAEDAINPAQISAGPAVPPDTSASGEPGGEPAGGAPKGPTGILSSNESAIGYTRGQAYANRKQDMKQWLSEPMDSAAHDNTLQVAFDATSQAGPKVASEQVHDAAVKTAAARALIEKLQEEV